MNNVVLDVVDSLSNTPMAGATVSINNVAVGQTDQNGVFTLTDPDESDEVEISFVGYPTYRIAAGVLEGTAQIQMSQTPQVLPTVTVSPSPKSSSMLPWLVAGGLGIYILGGSGKKVSGTNKNTALIIGAGALGLGAVYLMTRPTATTPSAGLTSQQLVAQQAAAKAANNPLGTATSLFSSISKLFSGGSTSNAVAPVPTITDPGYSSPYDTSLDVTTPPPIDTGGFNLDTAAPLDLSSAGDNVAGLPTTTKWGRGRVWSNQIGAKYGYKPNLRDRAVFGSVNFNGTDDSGGDEGQRSYLYRRMNKNKRVGAAYGFKSNGFNRARFGSVNFNKTDDSNGDEGIYFQKKKRIGDTVNINDPTFNASQIVGQSLIAKTAVSTYDEPYDNANLVNTYNPGQTVGVVVSWLDADPANGRSVLYWQFLDSNGNFYYAPHYVGEFNVQALVDAGALTTGAQTQAAADANKGVLQTEIEKYLPAIIGIGAGIGILTVVLKNKK